RVARVQVERDVRRYEPLELRRPARGAAGRRTVEDAGRGSTFVERADELRVHSCGEASQAPGDSLVRLERREHATRASSHDLYVERTAAAEDRSVRQRAVELVQPGSVEEEPEPSVFGGQGVPDRQ